MAEPSAPGRHGLRALDWTVFKAALGGAAVASLLTAMLFAIDARLHPSGGPLNFSGAGFPLAVFAISFTIGAPVSLLALSGAVWLVGGARLRSVPRALAAIIGAFAGATLVWLALGIAAADWQDFKTAGFGALYGACVAGFWSHLVRE